MRTPVHTFPGMQLMLAWALTVPPRKYSVFIDDEWSSNCMVLSGKKAAAEPEVTREKKAT